MGHRRYCAAIDIGGTKIKTGLVDDQGRILHQHTMATPVGEGAAEAAAQAIANEIRRQCAESGLLIGVLEGIGVVCTGPVNRVKQTIENPYTLPGWEGFALPERLEALCGIPAKMEHDVNGAMIGEVFLHQAYGKRVLMVSLGTGIGVAVYDRDHPFEAGKIYHPEMGHVVVDPREKTTCYCKRSGCFESLCAGPALHDLARRYGKADFHEMYDAWRNGETALEEAIQRTAHHFIDGIWNLCVIFKPDVLVLGGGLMKRYYSVCRDILAPVLAEVPDFIEDIEIQCASFDHDSALVGASRLLFDDRS